MVNDLTCVPIDQDHPLVDQVSFLLELDVNRFQHLYASDDVMEPRLVGLFTTELIHQDEGFHVPFDLSGHVEACDNQVSPHF